MKTKKITAWILCLAMLFTILPGTFVFAAPSNGSPELVVNLYTQDSSMTEGADLVYGGENNYDIGAGGEFNKTPQEMVDGTWQNADMASKELLPASKRMAISIKAKSQGSGFGTGHRFYSPASVQYTYLDLDKNALHEEDDGSMLNIPSGEIEWHDYADLMTYDKSVEEFNKEDFRLSKVAAVNQQLVDNKGAEVVIWNIIRKEFSGYIRVKVTDMDGKSTIQDVLVIADGNHPEIEVTSTTEKNKIGEIDRQSYDVQIDGRKFISARFFDNTEINSDWKVDETVVSDSDMKAEIENMKDGKDTYVAHDYWAADDINLSIVATDSEMSSELKSVKWNVYNYPNTLTLIPTATDASIVSGSIVLDTYRDIDTEITEGAEEIDVDDASTNDLYKKTIIASDYLPGNAKGYEPQITEDDLRIPETAEGFNVLVVTAEDVAGLKATNYYYYFMDDTAPVAEFELSKTDKNVAELFTAGNIVTNRELTLDMSASSDVKTADVTLISDLMPIDHNGENVTYQYRLLNTDAASAGDVDFVPAGYSKAAPAGTNLVYGEWIAWTGSADLVASLTTIIDEEFDGLVQVRVQDRAGNWSEVVSVDENDNETIIADNTNAEIEVKVYANDGEATTVGAIENGTAVDFLDDSDRNVETAENADKNEKITTITGDKMPWINDSAVLEVTVKDEDLTNAIRSSGLEKGEIVVEAKYHDKNQTKEAKIWKNGATAEIFTDSITIDTDHLYDVSGDLDKALKFFVEYEGTGVVDITVSIKDQADVNDSDAFSTIYKTQLRVDKINPYIIYKGYDLTEKTEIKLSNGTDMPWGPNSQVLEVVVNDNKDTDIQSGFLTDNNESAGKIEVKSDKKVYIFKTFEDAQTHLDEDKKNDVKPLYTVAENGSVIIKTTDLYAVTDDNKEALNISNTFYVVYEGTGTAKIDFYAMDEAGNERAYPDADKYDAMLRVDTVAPQFDDVKLVEQAVDVDDVELFTLEGTPAENVTRKQLKLDFDVIDNIGTGAETGLLQSGVNFKGETPQIDGADVAITDVKGKYLKIFEEYYDNRNEEFVDMLENGTTDEDPRIEYILLPVKDNTMPTRRAGSTVLQYIEDYWKDEAWITTWNDNIVIEKEFQGAIVLRTIDRVGNVAYSDVIQVVAESKSPLVKFETVAPTGKAYDTLNQYGWAKRDVYFEVKVKDQNEQDVDAGIAKVVLNADINGAMSLEGVEIGTTEKEVSVSGEKDEDGYISLGFVKATETSTLTVTVYDKAEVYDTSAGADVAKSGNKTIATYNVSIDRKAPEVTMDAMDFTVKDNKIILNVDISKISDVESKLAPLWTESKKYNQHDGFKPLYEVSGEGEKDSTGQEQLEYYFKGHSKVRDYNTIPSDQESRAGYVHEIFNKDTEAYDPTQYELPGIQYALIPKNGSVSDVAEWNFETDPESKYDADGHYIVKDDTVEDNYVETNVWHNYVEGQIVANAKFDGYIVVRVVDKAGNITLLGTSSILDIEFDNDWKKDTQFIHVKASENEGATVISVEYFGNNDLLTPDGVHRDLTTEAMSGEGAFIEVVNEGITNVVIKSKTTITAADPIKLSDWEGDMNIGSLNQDWKYQFVDVKIDKQAPEFDFVIVDESDAVVTDGAVKGALKVKISDVSDPTPNKDVVGMSKISSGIAKVEWCAIPVGSSEEKWVDAKDWKTGELGVFEAAETATIKVRVTDYAGNVTEKSQFLRHDTYVAEPTIMGTNLEGTEVKLTSGDWVFGDGKVKFVNNELTKDSTVYYSINGSSWEPGTAADLKAGANTVRIQTRSNECDCESDVVTYIVNYDNGENPVVEVNYTDFADKWTKDPVTINVTAVQNNAKAEIEHISYKLKINDASEWETKYISLYNGRITFEEEGRYVIKDMTVVLESGRTYSIPAFEGDGVEVAKIDRTAPEVKNGAFTLKETENEVSDATLLIVGNPTNKEIRLVIDEDNINDELSASEKINLKYEYALIEKGNSVQNWEELSRDDVLNSKVIIKSAFDGTVLVKVSDRAGNETVVSKSIFTEGYKPEIEIVAPSTWQTENFEVKVNVVDNEVVSSPIKSVYYKYYSADESIDDIKKSLNEELKNANEDLEDHFDGKLISIGGTIEVSEEGERILGVIVQDKSGNINIATATVKLDKTAPEYSGIVKLLGVYNEHVIPESDWNFIHDGWTYNHDVSLDGIKDDGSGIKRVDVKFTSKDGATTATTLSSHQTRSNFSESGKYDLTFIDDAGNVRNISFSIDKNLENVINVIGVDEVGKLNIAVTDGDDMLSFYKKENSESKYTKMYNGVTDQLVDGKTGVRYIYGQNDDSKKTNTLYVIVAPSAEYGVSLMGLSATPNRYLNIDAVGSNVTVKKVMEDPTADSDVEFEVGEEKTFNSAFEINEDGVYSITTND